jgi:hypothetical protein
MEEKRVVVNGAQDRHPDWATLITGAVDEVTRILRSGESNPNQLRRGSQSRGKLCARGPGDGGRHNVRRNVRSSGGDCVPASITS